MILIGFAAFVFLAILTTFTALFLRRVVPTNEVHIVQSSQATSSYGKDTGNGNTYYEWPSWMPIVGVTKVILPVSNFDIDLEDYEAYDEGRLPFVVDVKAFFRIVDSNVAAQRVSSFSELQNQLTSIVQGAVRSILASNNIEEIMQGRSKFGDEFTKEVETQLANWGVSAVKNIELMDIRDGRDSQVIHNIMAKKKSFIEMESRTEVAKNKKSAQVAEIEAQKEVDLQKQSAQQDVGMRTTQSQREVELAKQTAIQAIKDQEKTTKEKEMSILQVESVRRAEIEKQVQLVSATQQKETAIIEAEGQKEKTVLYADGQLEATKRSAEGIELEGKARAASEKALQMAPVEAQITLAKEIGSNESYQNYLITIRKTEASEAIGKEQARALTEADIKVIANTDNPNSGLTNVMDLFSSRGGTQIGAMMDGLAQTATGAELVGKVIGMKK